MMATDQSEGMLAKLGVKIWLNRGMDSLHCYKGGEPFIRRMRLRSSVSSTLNNATMDI